MAFELLLASLVAAVVAFLVASLVVGIAEGRRQRQASPPAPSGAIVRVALAPPGWTAVYGSATEPDPVAGRPVRAWIQRRDSAGKVETVGLVEHMGDLVAGPRLAGFVGYRIPDGQLHFANDGPQLAAATVDEVLHGLDDVAPAQRIQAVAARLQGPVATGLATQALPRFQGDPAGWPAPPPVGQA